MRTPALLVLPLILLAGCGGGDEPATEKPKPLATESALVGALSAGEVMGRLVRTEADGTTAAVRGTVTFSGPGGSMTRTRVDSGGEFRIQLSPGRYTLRGSSPEVPGAPCVTDPPTTTLTEGEPVIVDVVCPAG